MPVVFLGCARYVARRASSNTFGQYRAFGASIAAGSTLSNPATQAFPSLVAQFENVPFKNNAIPGDMACDVLPRQVLARDDLPTAAQHPVYTLLVGTNDVDVKGTGAYESVFMRCYQAFISWLAIPGDGKIFAGDSQMTTTGTGSIDLQSWGAWSTGAAGSTVSFSITTLRQGPIYAWPIIDDSNPGTFAYYLDGMMKGSATARTNPPISTVHDTTKSLGFLRFPDVPAGTHVITFAQTSSNPGGVSVLAIGAPAAQAGHRQSPTVLLGTITYQLHGGNGGACTLSDDPCLQYNRDIQASANLFAADGLNVRIFDTRKYMFGTPAEMNDALHPNALGHLELSHAVEAVW